jgi:hypothetical protein
MSLSLASERLLYSYNIALFVILKLHLYCLFIVYKLYT